MEKRNAKILFNKAGGNAGANSYTHKISIPTAWIKELGFKLEDREAILTLENGKISIEKAK